MENLSKAKNDLKRAFLVGKINACGFTLRAFRFIHDYLPNKNKGQDKQYTALQQKSYFEFHKFLFLDHYVFVANFFFIIRDVDIKTIAVNNSLISVANKVDSPI